MKVGGAAADTTGMLKKLRHVVYHFLTVAEEAPRHRIHAA